MFISIPTSRKNTDANLAFKQHRFVKDRTLEASLGKFLLPGWPIFYIEIFVPIPHSVSFNCSFPYQQAEKTLNADLGLKQHRFVKDNIHSQHP
jgi:hypothetical protein